MTKNIKVAFYVYPTAFQSPGGGEIQLLRTKEAIEREGIPVTLFNPWTDKLKDFDILHTFGSVKEALPMMELAKICAVKNVLSTICWYSWKSAWGANDQPREKALALVRHGAKSFLPFLPSKRRRMMTISDLLIPNSESEARQLVRYFGVSSDKITVVPNGVDAEFSKAKPDAFISQYGLKDFILCVGRIEPRKNQLNMIRALKGIKTPFVIVGEAVHRYQDYYETCRKEADSNVHFLGSIPHGSGLLASAYAACRVFLLASWLETPGLAALEAGLAGANIVITQEGATREYFKDFASYVLPNDLNDIRQRTLAALGSPKLTKLKERVLENYLWEEVARKTIKAYSKALNRAP